MLGNAFTLKQLEALIWVADLGSFRKAARHLNTTQPNISARITKLEHSLGLRLMRRDAGSVQLTDKGQAVLHVARGVLHQSQVLLETANRSDLAAQRLRLGVTELIACTWLSAFLRALKQSFPQLTVELTVDLSRNLDRELAAQALDLSIQNAPFTSGVSGVRSLTAQPYVWVVHPDVSTDGGNVPLLTHARHTQAYAELVAHADETGLPLARIVASNSITACLQMALDGLGLALLPRALVARDVAAGRLVQHDMAWLPQPLSFVACYHAGRAPRFVGAAADLAQQIDQAETR